MFFPGAFGGGVSDNVPVLNPGSIALVINSSIAQSGLDATDYTMRRKIGGPVLAFNFGTSNAQISYATLDNAALLSCQAGPYAGLSFIRAIAAAIAAGATGVILSTYTPTTVIPANQSISGEVYPLAAYAGAAPYYVAHGLVVSPPAYVALPYNTWQSPAAILTAQLVPHGRLGIGDPSNPSIAEIPLRSGSGSIYSNCANLAPIAESLNNGGAPHALTNTLSFSLNTLANNQKAYNFAAANLVPIVNIGTAPPFSGGGGAFSDGVISPPLSLFAWCLGVPFNANVWTAGPVPQFANNYTVQLGGWWYNYTSFSAGMQYFLFNGGVAGIGTVGEPLSIGVPLSGDVLVNCMTLRCPLMLAAFLSNWDRIGATVWGDPLYSPYKSTVLYTV